jgi:hypothetical protein
MLTMRDVGGKWLFTTDGFLGRGQRRGREEGMTAVGEQSTGVVEGVWKPTMATMGERERCYPSSNTFCYPMLSTTEGANCIH